MKQKMEEILDSLIVAHQLEVPTETPIRLFLRIPIKEKLRLIHESAAAVNLRQAILTILLVGGVVALAALEDGKWKNTSSNLLTVQSGNVVQNVKTNLPYVALTFNVGSQAQHIPKILDILENHKAEATFFVTGEWTDQYPRETKAIMTAGHDLGNMGESYTRLVGRSKRSAEGDISTLHNKVKELTGYQMYLFRPPFGEYDSTIQSAAAAQGYTLVTWDINSLDWKEYGSDAFCQTILNDPLLGKGSIILCHSDIEDTVLGLDRLLLELEQLGYQSVRLSKLL
jgi:peptidoglycan/xylan/chitin deacetylase (PgdA/CDA1 family)